MNTKHKYISLAMGVYLATLGIAAGSDIPATVESQRSVEIKPVEAFRYFHQRVPQHKVVMATDKNYYLAGETIWLQAYLVSAQSHKPDTVSQNLYVEFINSGNELKEFLILKLNNGVASGSIQLPPTLPGGNYQIKAYTNWMINFPDDFHFVKDVFVKTPNEENFVERDVIRKNQRFNEKLTELQDQHQFAFFPEGGNLVAGIENRVAFMAADATGAGVEANGIISDGQGNEVARFSTVHDGKGLFSFVPVAGRTYNARVQFAGGGNKNVPLPGILPSGYVFRIDQQGDSLRLAVRTPVNPQHFAQSDKILILGHTRGELRYVENSRLVNNAFETTISSRIFPDGIAHFTLFGPDDRPIAERLVFVNNDRGFDPDAPLPFSFTEDNGDLLVNFYLPLPADTLKNTSRFVLGVTTEGDPRFATYHNLATQLLLTSDLGKSISDPWFYLEENTKERAQLLDLLMMTHGWRRFDWTALLNRELPELRIAEQQGLTLFGKISPVSSARPTGKIRVELSVGVAENRQLLNATTTEDGYFNFTGLNHAGTYTALISVARDRRGRIFEVNLFDRLRQSQAFRPGPLTMLHAVTERGPNWQPLPRQSFWQRVLSRDAAARRTQEPASMFGEPDQKIYVGDLDIAYTNVFDILRDRVTGLNVVGGQIVLRGVTSFMMSSEPVFFIDEVQVSRPAFLQVPVSEIERIEVLRSGASTAILGTRGGNGALLIYTKREMHQRQHSFEFQLRGYHTPAEFFQTRIQIEKPAYQQVPRTVLWAPMLEPDANGKVQVRLPAQENQGNLIFRFEGIDADGQPTYIKFGR